MLRGHIDRRELRRIVVHLQIVEVDRQVRILLLDLILCVLPVIIIIYIIVNSRAEVQVVAAAAFGSRLGLGCAIGVIFITLVIATIRLFDVRCSALEILDCVLVSVFLYYNIQVFVH